MYTLDVSDAGEVGAREETPAPMVFVIDDDAAVRQSLKWLIESVNLPVVAFGSAHDFLEKHDRNRPGCVLLDVRMPGMSGLELQERLVKEGCPLPIIFITGHGDIPMAVKTIKAGASDFIEKPFGDQDLLDRLHRAMEQSTNRFEQQREMARLEVRLRKLTDREWEVLEFIRQGNANKTIAAKLGLSEKTIEAHRTNLNRKLGATCVADLVRMAVMAESLIELRGKHIKKT